MCVTPRFPGSERVFACGSTHGCMRHRPETCYPSPARAKPDKERLYAMRTCLSGLAVAAAARRLDPQALTGLELADGLSRELLAVEQVAPRRSVLAAFGARGRVT